jgi:hypothetical protein
MSVDTKGQNAAQKFASTDFQLSSSYGLCIDVTEDRKLKLYITSGSTMYTSASDRSPARRCIQAATGK